jgi:hypothetical protein
MKGFNLFSQETDEQAEEQGVWTDYVDNGEVVARVLVARANNQEYARLMSSLYEKNRQVIEAGLDTTDKEKTKRADDISKVIDKKCFTRHIIKGWKGFVGPDGKEFKFTMANAELVYDRLSEFVRQVKLASAESNNYRLETIKKDSEALKK